MSAIEDTHEGLVLREDVGTVATLTLNRPSKLNALNADVLERLRAHLVDLAEGDGIAVVVVTGAGRSFCAGHDLDALARGTEEAAVEHEAETIDLLEALPIPTIAKIRGHCLTGGLELALACDLLVVESSAIFADTHSEWGLAPVWGMSVRLPERVGLATAKELMFTARRISGDQAVAMGLANVVVADGELDASVSALAARIASNSSGSHRIVKSLLLAAAERSRSQSLAYERTRPFGVPEDRSARLLARDHKERSG